MTMLLISFFVLITAARSGDLTCTIETSLISILKVKNQHGLKSHIYVEMHVQEGESGIGDQEYWRIDASCSNENGSLSAETTLNCNRSFSHVALLAKIGSKTEYNKFRLVNEQAYTHKMSNVFLYESPVIFSASNTCSLYLKYSLLSTMLPAIWILLHFK